MLSVIKSPSISTFRPTVMRSVGGGRGLRVRLEVNDPLGWNNTPFLLLAAETKAETCCHWPALVHHTSPRWPPAPQAPPREQKWAHFCCVALLCPSNGNIRTSISRPLCAFVPDLSSEGPFQTLNRDTVRGPLWTIRASFWRLAAGQKRPEGHRLSPSCSARVCTRTGQGNIHRDILLTQHSSLSQVYSRIWVGIHSQCW